MPDGHQQMNDLIRAGRGQPVDWSDSAAINRALREAAGKNVDPMAGLPPPPQPAEDVDVFHRWCEQAQAAGMDPAMVSAWASQWYPAHREATRAD